jgi:hypothetical protein
MTIYHGATRYETVTVTFIPFPLIILVDMTDIQALLSALDVFSRAPDKASLERANSWLQDFQHSVNCLSPVAILPTNTSDCVQNRSLSLA